MEQRKPNATILVLTVMALLLSTGVISTTTYTVRASIRLAAPIGTLPPPVDEVEPQITTTAAPRQSDVPQQWGTHKPERDKRMTYQNSKKWQHLLHPETITPGARLVTEHGACSAGIFAHDTSREYMIWAGHCGELNETVYVEDGAGQWRRFGTVVERESDGHQVDFGIVDITDTTVPWSSQIGLEYEGAGTLTGEELDRQQPSICRLGYRTGLACGDFGKILNENMFSAYASADHGDSGGAVFAVNNDRMYPVGMTSFRIDDHPDQGFYQLVAPVLQRYNLAVYSLGIPAGQE
ncbi:S1 family peptidase [Corynebacterium choanae]|uniref:Peptidase S1 domain-containing protein n=1 Tax=Corynebacterium choanae TaxID=1862358 RepID=A0A3G6JAH0_9CORY|nr:S1 family peptidase [Corynebacterium choanae]AZA12954.1 hypothetical protein CCHOA_02690 [Corynebacterium choanae]